MSHEVAVIQHQLTAIDQQPAAGRLNLALIPRPSGLHFSTSGEATVGGGG